MPSINFTITAEDKNLMRVLKNIEDGVKNTSEQVKESGDEIDTVFSKITKGAATMAAAFSAAQLVKNISNVRGEFQQLEVAFTTMLQSEEKANALMAQLTETAAITPFGLQEVASSAKQLLAYGVAAEDVNDRLIMLGDIAAGLSIPIGDLAYLYGTTMTQGRMYTQDLNQFMGRGIPIADELAKQFGVTKGKVKELVTDGKIGFEEMHKSLVAMTSEGGKFGGLMEAQSKTIKGQISNIEDAIDVMFNQIGQKNEGMINTALSFTSMLVQNYERIANILEPLVVTYGAYKVALMVASAVTKTKALTTGLATVAEKAHFLALLASEKAQKALNIQMLKNPYALAAAAIIALTYGIYKYITRASVAEKATESYNKAINKITESNKEYKDSIDKLVESIGNLDVPEGERIENFYKLKQEYPDILKNINTENEFLERKAELLKLINDRQKQNVKEDKEALLASYEEHLSVAKESLRLARSGGGIGANMEGYNAGANIKMYQEEVLQYELMIQKLKAEIGKVNIQKYLEGIKELSNVDIVNTISEMEEVLKSVAGASEDTIVSVKTLGGEFSKGQVKTALTALQSEQENRGTAIKKSASEWVAKYKKEYEDAEKAIKAFMQKRDSMAEDEFEKQLKDLTSKRDEAKKKYESSDNSVKEDQKQGEKAVKLQRELLNQKRDILQAEINLMKDGVAKKREQITLNYRKEIEDIKNQKEDWVREYGKLTDAQKKMLDERTRIAKEVKDKAETDLYKSELQAEVQALNDYLKEYGTIQQQKYIIAKEYDEKIAKETGENRKKLLQKQKEEVLASLDAQNLVANIDWGMAFSGVGKVLKDVAQETLDRLEVYMKTSEFANLSAENKGAYTRLRQQLIDEIGTNASSPFNFKQWGEIEKQVKTYQESVRKMLNAQKLHEEAVEKLKKAEEELAKATTTAAKEIASKEVEKAKIGVDLTARNLERAESNKTESQDNLVKSTNAATQGLKNFSNYLQEMSDGSLSGFANGLSKLITSLGKGSKGIGKSLEELGSKVGGIIGAVLSILDALGDKPAEFIEGLLSDIGNTIGNIIGDLPNIIGGIFRGIGDIFTGIIRGIGQVFGFHNDAQKERRIQQLQKEIESINSRYEKLEKEIDKAFSNDAKAKLDTYAALLERQKGLIEQQIREEESKKWDEEERVEKWKEEIKEIEKKLEEVKEQAIDAVFGEDLQSAISDFASSYSDVLASSKSGWASLKDQVREMMQQMVVESIKSALQTSGAIAKIREQLLKFFEDSILSQTEQDYIYKMAEDLQKELDQKFGWATELFKNQDSQEGQKATYGGFESMSEDTASELNGRFTALQMAGEEIKTQMISSVGILNTLAISASESNGLLTDIVTQHAITNAYLEDIVKYAKLSSSFGVKLDKIVEQTKNL